MPASDSRATTGQRKSGRGGSERAGQGERILAPRNAPAGGVVEDSYKPLEQDRGAAGDDEDERHKGRGQGGEQRRLARERDLALLDRVVQPLLGRLLGLVFVVDFGTHTASCSTPCRRCLDRQRYAASSAGGAASSISLRAAMPRTISAIALRAFATSLAGAEAPEESYPSTNRRPREGMDESTALRKSVSVPRSAMTTMSIDARSNSSARARSLSLGRSLKENSMVFEDRRVLRSALPERPHDILRRLGL